MVPGADTAASLRAGHLVTLPAVPDTIADGLRHTSPAPLPWEVNKVLLDDVGTTTVTGTPSSRPGKGKGPGMVTGRRAGHATPAAGLPEGGDGVVGTAELERPGSLQRLGLAHHGAAGGRIQDRAG